MAASVKFYNAWFCPFAQRAWIALLEKGVEFEYVEQDPYNKTAEWLAVNPRGMVPALVHNGRVVYESSIVVEYIDEAWGDSGVELLPRDPFERAMLRILSDTISKRLVPPFYQLLLKKGENDRSEAKRAILDGVRAVFKEMPSGGPFFGGATLNLADIMLAPFAFRFETILPHYRGFSIPKDAEFERYHGWLAALKEHPSFIKTLPDDAQKFIDVYQRYAEDKTDSLVAQAIRKGAALP